MLDRQFVRDHPDRVADAKARGHVLGHGEVDVRVVRDALQGRQLGALVQVLARMHVRDADPCTERRADRLPLDHRLRACDLCQGDVALGDRAVVVHLRCDAVGAQAPDPGELALREGRLRLLRVQLGLLDRDVERDEHRAGLDHLTRGLAVEFGPRGIRVNAINPGFIRTDMFETSHSPARQLALAAAHPLGRVGTPEEVAAVVAFLCSADAAFVSGAIIPVDGALTSSLAIPRIDS